jgi:hypothetical protein
MMFLKLFYGEETEKWSRNAELKTEPSTSKIRMLFLLRRRVERHEYCYQLTGELMDVNYEQRNLLVYQRLKYNDIK